MAFKRSATPAGSWRYTARVLAAVLCVPLDLANEYFPWGLPLTVQAVLDGLTPAGAAGLMGNLYAESELNPRNLQNSEAGNPRRVSKRAGDFSLSQCSAFPRWRSG